MGAETLCIPSIRDSVKRTGLQNKHLLNKWMKMRREYCMCFVCAKLLQSCPTLGDPVDCSLPGSSVHRILQARRLEWAAASYFRASSRSTDPARVSCTSRQILYHQRHLGGPTGRNTFCSCFHIPHRYDGCHLSRTKSTNTSRALGCQWLIKQEWGSS